MTELRLTGIEKRYGPVHAVRGVDLAIARGEFAVLVGPSGCGKTTLLRVVAGLETPDDGLVEIGGRVVNEVPPRDRDIAMVFQSYALYPYMTVRDNLAFPLRMRRVGEAEIASRVGRAAEMLGLGALLDRHPRQLSGGQRQRVAMGRALVRDARLYLFDEPLSNLDAQLRDEMRAEIKRLHRELGLTILYVTHDQIEAMTLADRVVLLRDGVIEQQGPPLALYERPATRFVARFLGSPAMSLVPGRIEAVDGGGAALAFDGGGTLPLPPSLAERWRAAQGRPVILGLRPEHLSRWRDGAVRPGTARLPVTVQLVEPTGARTYAGFALGGRTVLAELPAHEAGRPGETMDLAVDLDRAVLIDPATEQVIAPPAPAG